MINMRFATIFLFLFAAAQAQESRVVAISHRGEHLHHPENTMPAYRAAVQAGADFIETDVRTTSDGKLVIMHDGSVDRRTNGHGDVATMSFEEIRKLDAGIKSGEQFAGTQVPTFDEVLEFARGKIASTSMPSAFRPRNWSRRSPSTTWKTTWWYMVDSICIAACKS
jgi:hypothetical protein